jgi:hypothetical membrane protein
MTSVSSLPPPRHAGQASAGAIAWIAGTVQFFAVMVIVQLGWTTPYSWSTNNISDLGNVHCGEVSGRYICSPLHGLMNVSFVLGGLLFLSGILLTSAAWPRTFVSYLVRSLLIATSGGWMIAGLYPADINENLHVVGGAFVIFVFGNLALLLLHFVRTGPIANTRRYAVAFGALGLLAMLLHFSGNGLGLGVGGMERLTAYGVPVWLTITGISVLRNQAVMRAITKGVGV